MVDKSRRKLDTRRFQKRKMHGEDGKEIETYLNGIQHEPLSQEEETELATRMAAGDKAAREEFISRNLRLVIYFAKEYAGKGLSFPDLIGYGNIGLVAAVDKFDVTRGVKFATYAGYDICAAMGRALKKHNKQSTAFLKSFSGIIDAKSGLIISETIADEKALSPSAGMMKEEDAAQVREDLKNLEYRERAVIEYHYGIGSDEGMRTPEEVAKKFGATPERIRQEEERAFRKLRRLDEEKQVGKG